MIKKTNNIPKERCHLSPLSCLVYIGLSGLLLFSASCSNASTSWFNELFSTGKEEEELFGEVEFEYRSIQLIHKGSLQVPEGEELQLTFQLPKPAVKSMEYPLAITGDAEEGVDYRISQKFVAIAQGSQESRLTLSTMWNRDKKENVSLKIAFASEVQMEHEEKKFTYQMSIPHVFIEIVNKADVIVEYAATPGTALAAGNAMTFHFQSREPVVEDLEITYGIEGSGSEPADEDDYSSASVIESPTPIRTLSVPADSFKIIEGQNTARLVLHTKDDEDFRHEGALATFTIHTPGYTFSRSAGFTQEGDDPPRPADRPVAEFPISIINTHFPTISISPGSHAESS